MDEMNKKSLSYKIQKNPFLLGLFVIVAAIALVAIISLSSAISKKAKELEATTEKTTVATTAAPAVEAEKERLRAERRAANPEGIVENTSKKKLERKEREEREEAARRYELEKAGIDPDAPKAVDTDKCPSGIADRPYCKGRNYDPNRYSKK